MKKINLRGLQEKLSSNELKNVLGGSVGLGRICYQCNDDDLIYLCIDPTGGYCLDIIDNKCPNGWTSWKSGEDGHPSCTI